MNIQHTISVWNAYRKLSAGNETNDPAAQIPRDKMRRQISKLATEIQSPGDDGKKITKGWLA